MSWDPKRMGFFDHLDEFRRRLSIALAVILAGAIIAYFPALEGMKFLVAPLKLGSTPGNVLVTKALVATSPLEIFMLRFKVGIYMSLVATAPVWLYEVLAFVVPALKPKERRWFYPGLVSLVLFFILGNVFCYLIILGPSFKWMIDQGGGVIQVLPKATDYVNFVVYFLLGFGLAFETPVIVVVMVKLGVIPADALFKQWRWAVIIIMLVASFATPDWSPVTMLALAAAMLILYFGAALVARAI